MARATRLKEKGAEVIHLGNCLIVPCLSKELYEKALVEALKDKKIAGAALDVFENEPELSPGLADLNNVVLTPHIASATKETRDKMSEMAANNIIAVLAGETPPNLVK